MSLPASLTCCQLRRLKAVAVSLIVANNNNRSIFLSEVKLNIWKIYNWQNHHHRSLGFRVSDRIYSIHFWAEEKNRSLLLTLKLLSYSVQKCKNLRRLCNVTFKNS